MGSVDSLVHKNKIPVHLRQGGERTSGWNLTLLHAWSSNHEPEVVTNEEAMERIQLVQKEKINGNTKFQAGRIAHAHESYTRVCGLSFL